MYVYIYLYGSQEEPARASSPHFLGWHHLEIHLYVFRDYRMIWSPAIIVLVPILDPTAIKDDSIIIVYVSMEWSVRAPLSF